MVREAVLYDPTNVTIGGLFFKDCDLRLDLIAKEYGKVDRWSCFKQALSNSYILSLISSGDGALKTKQFLPLQAFLKRVANPIPNNIDIIYLLHLIIQRKCCFLSE